jgi:hypothetical protein
MEQVFLGSGDQTVEAENLPTFRKQTIAKMRTEKACCSSDDRAHEASENFESSLAFEA